jgi:TolB-like protein/tetratricopeptide (TPR) repeat protein
MIGQKLLHYEILEKLGVGGMGEVYRARDTKLGREVAIKVLPADMAGDLERRQRFRREAMAVAALQHPNIVTIFAVEEDKDVLFLAMELIRGSSLDRIIPPHGMNLAQLLEIAIPVADAVSYAHGKGITHRDLKPGNIMVDDTGRARVLDFGLAKLLEAPATADGATVVGDGSVTREGVVLGTASYMSPEQAEGKPTDSRSDIFSLGIILYEMATGQRPFQGETTISTISSILKDTPVSVTEINHSLPNHLGRVIHRCLAKEPDRRYQSALDVKNEMEGLKEESSGVGAISAPDRGAKRSGLPRPLLFGAGALAGLAVVLGLWRPWTGSTGEGAGEQAVTGTPPPAGTAESERKMAVVFPFENLGPPDQAYFAAGVTEEITSRLSSVSGLGVISRTSAVQYDRTGKTMKQIAEDLGVDYVLEGSVRWAQNPDGSGRVRITPQLVRASDDVHLWSQTYDREMDDIFLVQSDIAGHVIDQMGVTLLGTERERMEDRPTDNMEAYQAYMKGLDFESPDLDQYDRGRVELLEKAVALDPGFLAAWSELSKHHAFQYRDFDRTEARLNQSKAALQGAEAVDPNHPLTRLARGYYRYYGFRDYDRALEEFTAALEARPNDAEAQRSVGYILRRQGDLEGCIAALEKAQELDPQNTNGLSNLAATYRALRRFEETDRILERQLALERTDEAAAGRSQLMVAWKGDLDAARAVLPSEPVSLPVVHAFSWFNFHMLARDYESAVEVLQTIEPNNPVVHAYRSFLMGIAEARWHGREAARPTLEEAATEFEAILERAPGTEQVRSALSNVHALLGRNEAAVREAKLAVDLSAKDAFSGPQQLENLAGIYANTGQPEEALELLDRLLVTPYENAITLHVLRLDGRWDSLREYPGFQELFEKHAERLP